MSKSTYKQNSLNAGTWTGQNDQFTPFIALFKNDPTASGTGTEVSAADDESYARQQMDFDSSVDGIADALNLGHVTFPIPTLTAGSPNYQVTHIGIYDADIGGNLTDFFPLLSPVTRTNRYLYFAPKSVGVAVL